MVGTTISHYKVLEKTGQGGFVTRSIARNKFNSKPRLRNPPEED